METQCWICPICNDDHKMNNEEQVFCAPSDLVKLQSELTAYKEVCERLYEALSDAYDVLGYGRCRDAIVGRAITEYDKFKRERE